MIPIRDENVQVNQTVLNKKKKKIRISQSVKTFERFFCAKAIAEGKKERK